MSKIMDSTILGANTPKMVELLDELCINGQIYDKASLVPKPLEFLAFNAPANDIYFNVQSTVKEVHTIGDYEQNCVLIDDRNSDIVYLILNNNLGLKILKVSGEGKNRTIEKELYNDVSGTNKYNATFVCQDDLNVYLILEAGLTNTHIGKIIKATGLMEWTVFSTSRSTKLSYLFDYQGDLYFSCSEDNNKFSIVKYNKVSKAITTVLTDNGSKVSVANFRTVPTAVGEDNTFYVMRHDESFSNLKQLIIKKYVFDKATSQFSTMKVNMDLSILPYAQIPCYEQVQPANLLKLIAFKSKDNKEYIAYVSHRYDAKIYLFEKESSSNLILKQIYDLETTFFSCIPYNNNKTLIMLKTNMVYFYNFNEIDKKFELTSSMAKDVKNFGIDKNNNLWIQLNDNSVEAISNAMPIKIEAAFQNPNYEYEINDIETLLNVYAIDFKGGMLATQVNLKIIGPAIFSTNNSKKITVMTSSSNVIQVPIKITGSGFVKVVTDIN